MNCKKKPPRADMFPLSNKAWMLTCSNHGNIVKGKKAKHIPKRKRPKPGFPTIWISSPAHWKRAWLGEFAKRWKWIFDDGDRAFWNTQAASIAFTNEKNVTVTRTGFQLYMWYQWRCLTAKMDRYIPFPVHATDFAFTFTPPWDPPVIELPTIVSAYAPGTVRIRCLTETPTGLPLAPLCWWKVPPTINPKWTPGHHPWYWFDSTVDGDYTEYSYYIETLFPKIRAGTQATLVHCFGAAEVPSHGASVSARRFITDGVDWLNMDNAFVSDEIYASSTLVSDWDDWYPHTHGMRLTDFDFAIPTTAQVTGILVRVQYRDINERTNSLHAELTYNGAYVGSGHVDFTTWPASETIIEFGSPTDLWDWWTASPSTINDPSFGVDIYAQIYQAGGQPPPGTGLPEVDFVEITVYFTPTPYQFSIPTQQGFTFT